MTTILTSLRSALLAAFLSMNAASAAEGVYGDWSILCDNINRCEAVGYGPDAERGRWIALRILREAGPGTRMQAILVSSEDAGTPHPAITIAIDGRTLRGSRFDHPLTPAASARLIALMVDAQGGQVSDGKERWALPLSGMKAALLKMDEVQGRLDTPGALVRRGKRPESTVPAAPPMPVVRAAPRAKPVNDPALKAALIAQTGGVKGGKEENDADNASDNHRLYRLHDGQLLLLLETDRGSHQKFYEAWLAHGRPPYAPRLVRLPLLGGETIDYLTDASFDGQAVESYRRPSGHNDCGDTAIWVWTGQQFVLQARYEAVGCRGRLSPIEHRRWIARAVPTVR